MGEAKRETHLLQSGYGWSMTTGTELWEAFCWLEQAVPSPAEVLKIMLGAWHFSEALSNPKMGTDGASSSLAPTSVQEHPSGGKSLRGLALTLSIIG